MMMKINWCHTMEYMWWRIMRACNKV